MTDASRHPPPGRWHLPAARGGAVLLAAVFLAACTGGDTPAPPAPDPGDPAPAAPRHDPAPRAASAPLEDPAPTPTPLDTTTLITLVYWDETSLLSAPPPPPHLQALFDALLASPDPDALPFLADLAAVPNPFRRAALDHLQDRYDRPFAQTPYDVGPLFAATTPDDQPPGYPEFKRRLFGTILPPYRQILDAALPHTIAPSEIAWGGVGIDGIPPLEAPRFVSPSDAAGWIGPADTVIGLVVNGDARAYPVRIIAWHEMVNDTVGGVPLSLAYCTLCGSAIAYDGRLDGLVYRFGTSGLLYRSNKLMYDRVTGTLWQQFGGVPAWGPLVGSGLRLTVLPTVATTWAAWLADHPDTVVLDIDTGFSRDYTPGAAYADYNASPTPWFNAPLADDRLRDKDIVLVVEVGAGVAGETVAYPIDLVADRGLLHDRVQDIDIVVVATPDGRGARVYQTGGRAFRLAEPGRLLTDAGGAQWTVTEDALVGPDGRELARIPAGNAYWFAFVNLAPNGRLFEEAPNTRAP